MSQVLKPITACRICSQQFVNNPMNVPIIGEPADAQTERYVMALAEHLRKKHPDIFNAMTASGKMMMGYLALIQFNTQDSALFHMQEQVRYSLHRTTQKVNITDEHVMKAVGELGLESGDQTRVENLIRDLRDLLTDSGVYSPQVKAPAVA